MNTQQSVLSNLLGNVAKAIRDMPHSDFEKLVKGQLRPTISFKECSSDAKNRRSSPIISEKELYSIQMKLDAARTREEGYHIMQEAFPLKEQLLTFANFLDLPVQRKDKIERIQEKIVVSTVGRRLSSEAIRGGHSASAWVPASTKKKKTIINTKKRASDMAEENFTLLRKKGEDYCIMLRREGVNETREGHFRLDLQGEHWINGERCRPANIPGSPDAPGPWRALHGDTIEEITRKYEEEGWLRVPLNSFNGPFTEPPQ